MKLATYRFVEWRDQYGTVVGTSPTINLFLDSDATLIAYYEEIIVPTYSLSIATAFGGSTSPAPGYYSGYDAGAVVNVSATASGGYRFDGWRLDGAFMGVVNPISVIMDADHTLEALFSVIPTAQGTLECHALLDSVEVVASVEVIEAGISLNTPFSQNLNVGTYTVMATLNEMVLEQTVIINDGEVTTVNFQFARAPTQIPLVAVASLAGATVLSLWFLLA